MALSASRVAVLERVSARYKRLKLSGATTAQAQHGCKSGPRFAAVMRELGADPDLYPDLARSLKGGRCTRILAGITVHILSHGRALCGSVHGEPRHWGPRHRWVSYFDPQAKRDASATCSTCKEAAWKLDDSGRFA